MKVKVKKLVDSAVIPKYQTEGASGFDLHALEDVVINKQCYVVSGSTVIRTGLAFEIPLGYEMQIRPRSGMSAKTNIRVSNSPGTIDADFRGEVGILVDNIGDECIVIKAGDRVAQGVIVPVAQAELEEVTELSDTKRGDGKYGSTGK